MNEVNDFMSKFSSDIEVKWGLASDAAMGEKVKVTILATGFGVKDMVDKDIPIDAEAIEQKKIEDDRLTTWYGEQDSQPRKKEYFIYTFTPETLDNDDIISMVETKPTYMRKLETLKSIHPDAPCLHIVASNILGGVSVRN